MIPAVERLSPWRRWPSRDSEHLRHQDPTRASGFWARAGSKFGMNISPEDAGTWANEVISERRQRQVWDDHAEQAKLQDGPAGFASVLR